MHPGPFTRWPRTADAVLAVVLFVLTLSIEDGPGDSLQLRDVGDVPLLIVLLFAVGSGALSCAAARPSQSSPSCWPPGH